MSLTAFEQENLGTAAAIPLESTLYCNTKQANTSLESGSTAFSTSQSASVTCVTSLTKTASESARLRMAFSPSSVRHVY